MGVAATIIVPLTRRNALKSQLFANKNIETVQINLSAYTKAPIFILLLSFVWLCVRIDAFMLSNRTCLKARNVAYITTYVVVVYIVLYVLQSAVNVFIYRIRNTLTCSVFTYMGSSSCAKIAKESHIAQ